MRFGFIIVFVGRWNRLDAHSSEEELANVFVTFVLSTYGYFLVSPGLREIQGNPRKKKEEPDNRSYSFFFPVSRDSRDLEDQ